MQPTIPAEASDNVSPPVVFLNWPHSQLDRGWLVVMDEKTECRGAGMASRADVCKEQLGSWLNGLGMWDVYFTGTWSRPVSMDGCVHGTNAYLRWVEERAKQKVKAFWGVEKGPVGGHLHVHGLMGNVAHIVTYCGERLPAGKWGVPCCLLHGWPWGISRMEVYDPCLGASHYVGKYVVKNLAEWSLQGWEWGRQPALEFLSPRERVAIARGAGPRKLAEIRAWERDAEAKRAGQIKREAVSEQKAQLEKAWIDLQVLAAKYRRSA